MTLQINQIKLFAAISAELEKQAKAQKRKAVVSTRQANAIIKACNDIIAALATEDIPSKPGMGLTNWLASDDTGMSSKALAHHLCGAGTEPLNHHPLDVSDFGRCYRFFKAVPEARPLLPKMRSVSKQWAGLVDAWDLITAHYEKELPTSRCPETAARRCAETYALIQQAIDR